MANDQKSYAAGGRVQAPSVSVLCQLVINAWHKVKRETVTKSFRKYSISTTLEDTESDGLPGSGQEDVYL
ncbi:hypothetical protein M514_11844 [Trichuris suis]|uniref:DDE-1 domain-containing protein n=1 Tax=Trichuris suis TaxID=68888 RepID=A0A085LQP5_9BILA|nr:hypothetical protein M513_11844 [Trichuris suis]KFD60278.1 hypothetical protein M514_11844 [Trichuris suis]